MNSTIEKKILVPIVKTLCLKDKIFFHQRYVGDFHPSANNKPTHTFAYFGLGRPYYSEGGLINNYKYKCTINEIPNMIELSDSFWPEDLYTWVDYQLFLKDNNTEKYGVAFDYTNATTIDQEVNTMVLWTKDAPKEIERDAYVLGQHMMDLGYNGWFVEKDNECVLSQDIITRGLEFLDSEIKIKSVPKQESHGDYYI